MGFLPKVAPRTDDQRRAALQRSLMRKAGEMGGQLFGPVPKGHRRQFFCLDAHTWIWHEEWMDQKGQRKAITTRYDVRPDGILKLQDGQPYQRLSPDEAQNLYRTTQLYRKRVGAYYQNLLQAA